MSTYAARTCVALVSLEGGTAEDVSDLVEVPRTRVYRRSRPSASGLDPEAVHMRVGDLLTEAVTERIRAASDRGVATRLAGMSSDTDGTIQTAVPGADEFDSLWDWSDTPAGRLLVVDRERTLVSVLVDGNGDHPPEPRDETAIWGSGEANSLVVVLRAMFTWDLDDGRD